MEYDSNPLTVLGKNEASKKPPKQKSFSRKRHHKSAKHRKLRTHGYEEYIPTQAKEYTYSSNDSFQYVPIEERVLRKLKRERKLLKKWTVELNRAKSEICNSNADEVSVTDPKMSEIQKRYQILLPAIKFAMHTMDQAVLSKTSMNDSSSIKNPQQGNDQIRKTQQSVNEDMVNQRLPEKRTGRWLKESKEHNLVPANTYQCDPEKNLNNPDSRNSLMTDISKQQLARRARQNREQSTYQCIPEKPLNNPDSGKFLMRDISKQQFSRRIREQYIDSMKVKDKAAVSDKINDPQSLTRHCQPLKQISTGHARESSVQIYKPGADGEIMEEMNVSNIKRAELVNDTRKSVLESVTDKNVWKRGRQDESRAGIRDESKTTPKQAVVSVCKKYHANRNFLETEQNVLCTGPNNASPSCSTASLSSTPVPAADTAPTDLRSQTSWKTIISNAAKINSSEEQTKCKCKDKKNSKPCICKCYCEEESGICDSKTSLVPFLSSVPSSNDEEGRFTKKKTSPENKNQEAMQVQTSFPSSIGPCKPETCPKRRNRRVENRDIEVQTDDTDIEWQYEPPMTQCKRNVVSAFKIPPKRTATMDDRLLRRIMFFDSHQSSVCNKNVQFCTYNVQQTKRGFLKNAEGVPCSDCPGSRKCKIVLSEHPYHLTCNEIVVEVKSLELNQEGVDSLMRVCSFLYIDYVFLGHVGNETNLAPVSSNVLFDSRKTYSVSLRFNKKERSILREQFSPSGLLVKDSIMFIVVCQAAPEFDINKNWDFGFGYLSMKQIGEQMGSEDKISLEVEMQKIGGTKNNIGRLLVTIEGLKTIRIIMNEELRCVEPQVDAVMKKLMLNKKEMTAMDNNQTACKRRTAKKKK